MARIRDYFGWPPLLIVMMTVSVVCILVGCRSAAAPKRQLKMHVPKRTFRPQPQLALKPPVEGQTSQVHSRRKRLDLLFAAHQRLERDVDILHLRLQRQLSPEDAAHVTTLHRLYSTGQFLRELEAWAAESGTATLTSRDRTGIADLLNRWREWESLMIAVSRGKGPRVSR